MTEKWKNASKEKKNGKQKVEESRTMDMDVFAVAQQRSKEPKRMSCSQSLPVEKLTVAKRLHSVPLDD